MARLPAAAATMPVVQDLTSPYGTGSWRRRQELAGDASQRRYCRLEHDPGPGTAVRVEYAGETAATIDRDLEVLRWCRARGLRVPRILDSHPAQGWIVLEDFGDADAAATLRETSGPRRRDLFRQTMQPLAALAALPTDSLPRWNRPLDAGRLRYELAGFELWYLRYLRGISPTPAVSDFLDRLAVAVAAHPQRICHRDYHLNNLFFLADGEVGIIDVQDILVGPDTYDAASLLEERDTPELIGPALAQQWLEEWAVKVNAPRGYRQRFDEVRLQRALKVLGTFSRLLVAGRSRYRSWLAGLEKRLGSAAPELGLPPSLTSLLID